MIYDMNEALRQLLVGEMPIKNGEVDIAFEQPGRQWSSQINRPTINFFLYDVRENLKLRGSHQWRVERQPDGTALQRRPPVKVDLHYLITAWATDSEDEHNLLGRVLLTLFRIPSLPEALLPDNLQNQATPVVLEVSQDENFADPVDIWSVLDNDLRPSINLTVTLTVDPYEPTVTPMVGLRELRMGQAVNPLLQQLVDNLPPDVFWTIGGRVQTDKPLADVHLSLVERGLEVPIQPDGRFTIGQLRAGEYTLEVVVKKGKPKQHKITVPAPDYDLKV